MRFTLFSLPRVTYCVYVLPARVFHADERESDAMHMADALITPAVGGTMWAVSGGLMA